MFQPAAALKFAPKARKRVTLATLARASLYRRHCGKRHKAAFQPELPPICSQKRKKPHENAQ
jgi:hypothetical protein